MAENLPAKGSLVSDDVKTVFKDSMDALLVDLGRTITLNLKPTKADCPNCSFDDLLVGSNRKYNSSNTNTANGPLNRSFADGQMCPICNNKGILLTPRTASYTATISKKYSEEELAEHGATMINKHTVKTNTVIESYAEIVECENAVIDGKLFRRNGEPIKTGLQELIRVKVFWTRAD